MLRTEDIVRTFGGTTLEVTPGMYVVARGIVTPEFANLALSPDGRPTLLIHMEEIPNPAARLTRGLTLKALPEVHFRDDGGAWSEPAAILECMDAMLMRGFCAIVVSMISRLEKLPRICWSDVCVVFSEWERLLARRKRLTDESELGLWGELWCLATTAYPDALLEGWQGPDGEASDFAIGGHTFEVKTGHQRGVHYVSQRQLVDPGLDEARVLISVHVVPEPFDGRSLADLVEAVAHRVMDSSGFEEKLASVGYSRADEDVYRSKYTLAGPVELFLAGSIPRVRLADPGVSHLRYRVELTSELALDDGNVRRLGSMLGIDFGKRTPCV